MDLLTQERKKRRYVIKVFVIFLLLITVVFLISLNVGTAKVTVMDVLKTIIGQGTPKAELVLFKLRLPRAIIAIIVGASLAVAGCIMQTVTRNALADPGIIGINAGAGLAVVFYVSFLSGTSADFPYLMPLMAWIGAIITAIVIFLLSYSKKEGFSPNRMILMGIAVGAGLSAANIVLTMQLKEDEYSFIVQWLVGTIWGSSWSYVQLLAPFIVVLFPLIYLLSRQLNMLTLSEQISASLGVALTRTRIVAVILAIGLSATAVAVSGSISFVGLIAPHLVRRLVGAKHQYVLPMSAIAGAFLVVLADTIGRTVMAPYEIPTGIVAAIIGAPYFLYLLSKSRIAAN
jgi:iron complex transport system permease protein